MAFGSKIGDFWVKLRTLGILAESSCLYLIQIGIDTIQGPCIKRIGEYNWNEFIESGLIDNNCKLIKGGDEEKISPEKIELLTYKVRTECYSSK